MVLTLSGMTTDSGNSQFSNAESQISVSPSGNVIDVNDLQPSNARADSNDRQSSRFLAILLKENRFGNNEIDVFKGLDETNDFNPVAVRMI